ncbi:protein kinase domain-containing protein [Tundrisphaera lichenicola]|uniref:protein kinase domain-containing protein n=1 Tax=Tundrisphaera lichenicola TaxID=2029860 RepID=UPI003EBD3A97
MNVVLRVTAGPHSGMEYTFDRHETFVIGRSSQVQFPVPEDGFLSRNHFLIEFNPPVCYLRDLGSTNGTKVNGLRVDGVRLRDGDTISAGESSFVIRVEETTWEGGPKIQCLGCGKRAPEDLAISALPDEDAISWLCDDCVALRRKYPTTGSEYLIEKKIGGGGMGEVYLARHLPDNKQVAIKMMVPSIAASARAKLRFQRELDVLKNLRHPNIVEYYTMFELNGQFQLVMEYVVGKNAMEWVRSLSAPLSAASGARIGFQLMMALDHAHTKGYVHRDIKPSNILITGPTARPTVKLSDFGLAKSFRDDAGFAGLTHQGDIGGSGGFISPDHIRDFREAKEPADIYSAGATLYFLFTNQYPFYNFNPHRADAYTMILEHPAVPLRAHRPDLPEGLDKVLRKALEKQPKDRWKSAAAMAIALKPYLDAV